MADSTVQKQRIISLGAICAACAVLLFLTHSREPSYNGHHLRYWVRILGTTPGTAHETQMASEAVDHIGAAAAPFLVRWIQYRPTRWTERQKKLADRICKARYPFALRLGRSLYHTRGERLANGATQAFRVLGTNAALALDELCRVMNDLNARNDPRTGMSSTDRATYCLSWLGTNALPALTAVIENPQRPRWQALNSIWLMEQRERTAQYPITAIIGCLEDAKDPNVPMTAARILGDLKVAPEVCLPALLAGRRSKSRYARAASASALAQFGEQAASAIPALMSAAADPNLEIQYNAATALHAIAPGTYTNVPPLPHWEEE